MSSNKIYVGSRPAIIVECGIDISAASARRIEARKPDGTIVSWAAAASGATAIRFDALADTLDQGGVWKAQPHVTLDGIEWPGATAEFEVFDPFA